MNSRVDKRKDKKRRKWPYWVGGIFFGLILLAGSYLWYLYDQVGDTVATMHNPLERDANPERQEQISQIFTEKDSINVLLLGVDEREGDSGRSDTMILLSANPNTNALKMVSIPRDTYVTIPGYGKDKINHAYAFGGVGLSVQTVEEAFNIPVHFYARVNMQGFEQGVEALGGVTVTNDTAFTQGGMEFPAGEIHLSGEEALEYIRMRKEDPRGDLGRNERQREVVTAAMDKAASFSSITRVGEILGILGENVTTNLDQGQMQTLFLDYRGIMSSVETLEISGSGDMINGIWYLIVPDEEFQRITTAINEHMEAR